MGTTSRFRLVVALTCAFCALAVVVIGGLGVIGIRSALNAGAEVATDEVATATITSRLAHDVDRLYAFCLDGTPRAGSVLGSVRRDLFDRRLPAVESELAALRRVHEGDSTSELADIDLLGRQWVTLRAVVNQARPAGQITPGFVSRLKAAYVPLSRHLADMVDREATDAVADHQRVVTHVTRVQWGVLAAVVATILVFLVLCTVLVRLLRRVIEPAHEQVEFADTLQLAEHEAEAHGLLQRFLERLVAESTVTIFNRNNSADRLEAVTEVAADSTLRGGLAHAEPRSCLAVRSARVHDEDDGRPSLLRCGICGGCPGFSTCAPLTVGGEVIGSVLVNRSEPYGSRQRNQIRDAVAQSAPVLANLRNLAIAELRASTDSLTGLPNKRAVTDSLNRMLAQATRALSPLSVLVLDLDHFKDLNDRFGHPTGDQVLANVGATVRSALREGDFAGRNGGEEFMVILPDTDVPSALTAAEKIRALIEDIAVPGVDLTTTVSVGVAGYPEHAANPDRLERLADAALYLAKRSGRNRVEVATTAVETGDDRTAEHALRAMS